MKENDRTLRLIKNQQQQQQPQRNRVEKWSFSLFIVSTIALALLTHTLIGPHHTHICDYIALLKSVMQSAQRQANNKRTINEINCVSLDRNIVRARTHGL